MAEIEHLLDAWQFTRATTLAEQLLLRFPDLPAVQRVAAWVKFHQGEHQAAVGLIDRLDALSGVQERPDSRTVLIRAAARLTKGFVEAVSPDRRVIIRHAPGVDRVLVPDVIDAVKRTLDVVGDDLDHHPDHPIRVEILPDASALADLTGLTIEEIETSGTIAVCKFGRLMVTSPRATLKGFSYLDTASHELVHLIISQKTFNRTPIWIHEALAKFEESRWRANEPLYHPGLAPLPRSRLAGAIAQNQLIPFSRMHPSMALLPSQEAAELAFSEVYTVTQFLLQRKGYPGIRQLLQALALGREDFEAMRLVYGLDRSSFVSAWMGWLKRQPLQRLEGDTDRGGDSGLFDRTRRAGGERALDAARRVDARDHFHLGQLLRARERNKASAAEYDRALALIGERHAASWVIADKLGLALMQLRQIEPARRMFERSLEIQPGDLEAHLHLGMLWLNEDPLRSFLHLREALRLNPMDPRVHASLVATARRLAQQGDTSRDWQAVAERHQADIRLVQRFESEPAESPAPEANRAEEISRLDATIKVISKPWARLWLDGHDTGLTTPIYQFRLAPGRHILGLKADCASQPHLEWVDLDAGQELTIERQLCAAPPVPAE